jgi:enoyl-CoA hydratase
MAEPRAAQRAGAAEAGELVHVDDAAGVRTLRLARPPVNALDLGLVAALDAALRRAEEDEGCRAVVLAGAPGVFSGGLDLRDVPAYERATRRDFVGAVNTLVARLYGLAKPTVAAITGHAIGGGLVLALACDLRMAAEGTYKLGLTEAAAGFAFPEGPLIVVRHELDPQTARRLVLASSTFGPRDRLARSFVDEVAEPDLLVERAARRAARLAEQAAFTEVKRQLRAPGLAELERILPRVRPSRARGPGGG